MTKSEAMMKRKGSRRSSRPVSSPPGRGRGGFVMLMQGIKVMRLPMNPSACCRHLAGRINRSAGETPAEPRRHVFFLVQGSAFPAFKYEGQFLEKLLNGTDASSIEICGTTAMNHQPWQTGILALSLILSLAGCGKEQKTVAASTNAPAGTVDK